MHQTEQYSPVQFPHSYTAIIHNLSQASTGNLHVLGRQDNACDEDGLGRAAPLQRAALLAAERAARARVGRHARSGTRFMLTVFSDPALLPEEATAAARLVDSARLVPLCARLAAAAPAVHKVEDTSSTDPASSMAAVVVVSEAGCSTRTRAGRGGGGAV